MTRAATAAFGVILIGGLCFGMWKVTVGKTPAPLPAKPPAAASVKPIKEDDLATVKLTEESERRLGVRAGTIELKNVSRVRIYGGEVMAPLGRTILVAAPVSGLVKAAGDFVPQPGQMVTKGQAVLTLVPLLSPDASTTLAASRADAEGQIKSAETQSTVTKLALDRADHLFKQEAGSRRAVEEAQAQFDLAGRTLDAARARLSILSKALGDAKDGRATPITIEAPDSGMLRAVSAMPGQNVPSGGALFEVVGLSEVWVRVPVYVGDAASIAGEQPAAIGPLNMQAGAATWQGRPVTAPPSANSLAATVDLYYVVDNASAKLKPGQRVAANLSLTDSGESLTVPWSAVVHDIYGGTWIYVVAGERTYKRQRVAIRYVADKDAVLASGPPPGTAVVADGAIELFGAETGFSK